MVSQTSLLIVTLPFHTKLLLSLDVAIISSSVSFVMCFRGEKKHYIIYTQMMKYTNRTMTWSFLYRDLPFLFGIHIWVYTSHIQSKDSPKFKFRPNSARVV